MNPLVDEFTIKIKDNVVKKSRSHKDQMMELLSVKSNYKRYVKRLSVTQNQDHEPKAAHRKKSKYQKYIVNA